MSYTVILAPEVYAAIDEQIAYLLCERVSQGHVDEWVDGVFRTAGSLSDWPRRHPVAETVSDKLGQEVRRARFREHVLFYTINDSREIVDVIALRHGRREPWTGRGG